MSATNTHRYLDNTGDDPTVRARLVVGDNDFHSVTEKVCGVVERPQPKIWWVVFAIRSPTSSPPESVCGA